MATFHELITLSDSEQTEITPGPRHSGLDVTIQNVDQSAIIYIGGDGVTAEDYGYKLMPGLAISFELNPRNQIFVISDTNESKAALLRVFLEDLK